MRRRAHRIDHSVKARRAGARSSDPARQGPAGSVVSEEALALPPAGLLRAVGDGFGGFQDRRRGGAGLGRCVIGRRGPLLGSDGAGGRVLLDNRLGLRGCLATRGARLCGRHYIVDDRVGGHRIHGVSLRLAGT